MVINIKWIQYPSLEPLTRLPNQGRELLGNFLQVTEKRDGENVSIWLDQNNVPKISSHNMEQADQGITERLKQTPEYKKIIELLIREKTKYHTNLILFGELLQKESPTKIEPNKKFTHWILFDIYSREAERYLGYNRIYQYAYSYKIPIVKMLEGYYPKTVEQIQTSIEIWLQWCKEHRREGIVIKDYKQQIFIKHRIDLPKTIYIKKPNKSEIQYPEMPQERIIRALQHAYDELKNDEDWNNIKKAMPTIVKHLQTEAKEHKYNIPKNIQKIYLETNVTNLKNNYIVLTCDTVSNILYLNDNSDDGIIEKLNIKKAIEQKKELDKYKHSEFENIIYQIHKVQ